MTVFTAYEPGVFCWVDLMTNDPEAAKSFYCSLFGWTAEDMPAEEEGTYTMFTLDGKLVAALADMGQERREQGMPPSWNSYINVESADAAVSEVQRLGGKLLMEPFDVLDVGRMAVVSDPSGGIFAVWQAIKHIGAELANVPGSLAWNELATRDDEAAKSFYSELFGWQHRIQPVGDTRYTSFFEGVYGRAGMIKMNEQWPENIPPHWMVYLAVADTDQAVKRAQELGATVHVPPTDIPEVGRFAVIADPQGAVFSVIKVLNPPE